MKPLLALALTLSLTACGSLDRYASPSNLDRAADIYDAARAIIREIKITPTK